MASERSVRLAREWVESFGLHSAELSRMMSRRLADLLDRFAAEAVRDKEEQIARLTAERDALRRGHATKAKEAEEYERAWRLQGIHEGLEWAAKACRRSQAYGSDPEESEWNPACEQCEEFIRAGDPEQIAAEADKEET